MTFAIVDSSSGAASAAAMNPAIDLGRGRQEQHAADDRRRPRAAGTGTGSRRRSCRRRRGSPRTGPGCVLASTSRSSPSAVTTSAASRLSIVSPCLRDEVADAAAERDPADPDRAGVAEPGREAVRAAAAVYSRGGQPGLGPRGPAVDVDVERAHVRRSSTMPPSVDAVPGAAVAAAADGELEPGLARERDDAARRRRRRRPARSRRVAVDAADEDLCAPGRSRRRRVSMTRPVMSICSFSTEIGLAAVMCVPPRCAVYAAQPSVS